MNQNLFAVCITATTITFVVCAKDFMIEFERGAQVRNILRLREELQPLLPEQKPSIEIPNDNEGPFHRSLRQRAEKARTL
jgi:hypothetical protein